MGPIAVPGSYQVKLTANGKTFTASFEIREDPRVKTSQADLQKQFDLALQIRDAVDADHKAELEIRDVRTQLEALKKRLKEGARAKDVTSAADDFEKKMAAIESEIVQPKLKSSEDALNYPIKLSSKLMALEETVESADTAPSAQCYEVFKMLDAQLQDQLAKWKQLQSKDLASLNGTMRKEKIEPVMVVEPEREDTE